MLQPLEERSHRVCDPAPVGTTLLAQLPLSCGIQFVHEQGCFCSVGRKYGAFHFVTNTFFVLFRRAYGRYATQIDRSRKRRRSTKSIPSCLKRLGEQRRTYQRRASRAKDRLFVLNAKGDSFDSGGRAHIVYPVICDKYLAEVWVVLF